MVKKKPTKKTRKSVSNIAVLDKRKAAKQKLQRQILRRNKAFDAASSTEKRVMVAKDVIAQLKAGRFQAYTQTWATPRHKNGTDLVDTWIDHLAFDDDPPAGRQAISELFLGKKIAECECCALGAIFMSCAVYSNKTTVKDFVDETFDVDDRVEVKNGFTSGLSRIFSPAQLKLVEIIFEGGHGAFDSDSLQQRAVIDRWNEKFPEPKQRMIAIMENIVKNNGTFKP